MTPLPLSFQIQSCNVLTPSTSTSTFTGDFASKQIKDIHTANPKQKRKMNMLQFNPNLQSSQEFRFGPKRPRQLQLHNHGHMDAHVQILQFNPNLQTSQEFRFGPKMPQQLQLHNHGHMDAHVQIPQFNSNLQPSQEFRFGLKRPRQLQLHNHGHMDAHVQILHHVCNLLALFLFFFFLIFYFKYDLNVCYERDANFLF